MAALLRRPRHDASAGEPRLQRLIGENPRLKLRRHRTRNRQPVANLMTAIARDFFQIFIARVAAGDILNRTVHHTIEKPTIELLVDPSGLRRSNPMRQSARSKKGDALIRGPALDASAHERANVEAALGTRHRRRERVHYDWNNRQVPARRQMDHRSDFSMVEREFLRKSEIDAALQPFAHDKACEITRDRQAHLRHAEIRDRRAGSLFANADQEGWQIVEEAAIEMVIRERDKNIGTGIFENLARAVEP